MKAENELHLMQGRGCDPINDEDLRGGCINGTEAKYCGRNETAADAREGRDEGDMSEGNESSSADQRTKDDVNGTVDGNDQRSKNGICAYVDENTEVIGIISVNEKEEGVEKNQRMLG